MTLKIKASFLWGYFCWTILKAPLELTLDNEINERSIIPTSTPLFWVTGTPNEPPVVYSKRNLQDNVDGYLQEDPDSWLQEIDNYVIDQSAFKEHDEMPVFK